MADDIILHQRLASGYVPGLSETFANGKSPVSAVLQNCQAIRFATGIIDVLVGPPQASPLNQTTLRSSNGPAPVGIGGVLVTSPPLNVVGGAIVVNQGRVLATIRSVLTNPSTNTNPMVTWCVLYGATLGPIPVYPGFSNAQIVRFIFSGSDDQALDVDFDFSIERVIDPNVEP
jgi:hypothetical protein